jgi:hypothetical protein
VRVLRLFYALPGRLVCPQKDARWRVLANYSTAAAQKKKKLHQVLWLFFVPTLLAPVDFKSNVHHRASAPDANIIAAAQYYYSPHHRPYMLYL